MSAQETKAPHIADAATVARQNDAFRQFQCLGTGDDPKLPGRTVATQALHSEGQDFVAKALRLVGDFATFEPDNDPDGFHDFGAFEIDGKRLFFKIDLFEASSHLRWGAETPDDPATTERVLTIMMAFDW